MDTKSILENGLRDETLRTILREAKGRFDRQIMDDDERCLVIARIKRLNRRLGLV